MVGRGRPETIHQMAVGFELYAVQPCRLHALSGAGIIANDALDIPILDLLWKRPMGGFAHG
ncbi:hypothetical protein D3C72_2443890 [compost metagenome]